MRVSFKPKVPCLWSKGHFHVIAVTEICEKRFQTWISFSLSLSLSLTADRYSAASLSGRLGLDQHSCRSSRISPVFVSHSSVAWPLLFPLHSALTFQLQEQIQDSSGHEGTYSVVSPPSAFLYPTSVRPVGASPRLGPAKQTEGALCARQSGQICLPLNLFPF